MRRISWEVPVGNLTIGGEHPIAIQTMLNKPTQDIDGCLAQIKEILEEDCQLIRLAVTNSKDVLALCELRAKIDAEKLPVALIADVHFRPQLAIEVLPYVEKVRINPGNFACSKSVPPKFIVEQDYNDELQQVYATLQKLIDGARENGVALRIGGNAGSLSDRIVSRFGNTRQGLVESVMEMLRFCHAESFDAVVISLKSSNPRQTLLANRELIEKLDENNLNYPIHLGVTEAGFDVEAIIKSSVGIGSLLLDGIGDTIRVSLAGPPAQEIPIARQILQATGHAYFEPEYIVCPTCGRTKFDIEQLVNQVKERTQHLKGVKIAIMGCIVNGPGEMAEADFGFIGKGKDKVDLYAKNDCVAKNLAVDSALESMLEMIDSRPISKSE